MAKLDYPIYNFKVKEDGTDTGMIGISLVTEPTIMSEWQLFKEVKPHYIALKNEDGTYKQELLGAALRPDIPILRKDDAGNFYYGIFEKETIEVIRNKFFKQKNTSNVNIQHNEEYNVDAFLIESFIIQNEEQLEATKSLGLEDIEVGAWIVRYKVESEEVFEKALAGDLTGFSVEILLQRELVELHKNNFKQTNNSIMSKFKELVERFKSVLSEFEDEAPATEEVSFEDVVVAESGAVLRVAEVGSPVMVITTGEDGTETEEAAAEGEYIADDGRTIVVDADSNLVEIVDAPAEEEAPAEDASEETLAEGETPAAEGEKTDLNKTLAELIPTDKDGSYQLEVYVSDGKFSFGTLYAYTYTDLKLADLVANFEALKTEKADLDTEVEKLQAEIEKPIGIPVFTEFKGEKNKKRSDFKNNLDYTLHRLGLEDND